MNIADILAQAQGGRGLESLGRQFGLDDAQTRAAVEALGPMVAAGVSRNASSDGGLADLFGAVLKGNHSRYADDPDATRFDNVAGDGNAILGHIFGSRDVSRGVAQQAAGLSGIGEGILKKMLPVIASMVMGVLAKKMFGGGSAGAGQGGGLGDILGGILGGGSGRGAAPSSGGGGLGDILGDILGGGAGGQARQQAPGGGGLEDMLKDILGGGAGGQAQRRQAPTGGQGGGLEDMLKDIFGGGAGGGGNPDIARRGREVIDETLGRPRSRSSNPADDMLNSVEEAIRRR
jgi:Bacterial protein of unknown function (DUF937)